MMEANFRDQKLFSKLVNQKRNTNQGYTSMIKIEGVEHRGDAQVLSGFFNYHNGNSSPPPLSKSAENTTYFLLDETKKLETAATKLQPDAEYN